MKTYSKVTQKSKTSLVRNERKMDGPSKLDGLSDRLVWYMTVQVSQIVQFYFWAAHFDQWPSILISKTTELALFEPKLLILEQKGLFSTKTFDLFQKSKFKS